MDDPTVPDIWPDRSCGPLDCTVDRLVCHRCGQGAPDVEVTQRFVVDNWLPCLAGAQPKATGHFTHACEPCATKFAALVLDQTAPASSPTRPIRP